MTIPPKYSDIGKSCADLFNKDYPIGVAKLEVKTTASNGVNFTVSGNQDIKTGGIHGELKTKYADKAKGLTLSETWTSSNTIGAEIELADSLTKGLKLGLNGNFSPATSAKNAKASVEYKQDYLFTNLGVDVFKGPLVNADASIGIDDVVVGGEVGYNVKDGKVAKYGAVLGYTASDFAVAVHALSNFNTFSASYFHRVNGDLDVGGRAVWDRKSANATVALEAGAKYSLDKDAFVKAKVNNAGVLGLGFTQTLREGVKVALGGSFDTARLNENAHKLGMSLTFEA